MMPCRTLKLVYVSCDSSMDNKEYGYRLLLQGLDALSDVKSLLFGCLNLVLALSRNMKSERLIFTYERR